MNIGVIGGSGFIGSHVVDKLIDDGHAVSVLDIMKPHRSDVRHIYIDILDMAKTTVALSGNYDAIYLLAAVANVNDVKKNPVESIEVNVQGTANVAEALRRNGIPRLILASTIWVYNLSDLSEVDEETPLRINAVDHVYTASKLASELVATSYAKLYGLEVVILRYGIPYGPRARGATLLALFIEKAMRGERLIIQGDGSQTRNFVYVEDLAFGNVSALKPSAANRTYNLDGLVAISVKEVAEMVKRLVGKNVVIEFAPARDGDYKPKKISIKRAVEDLDWSPQVNFRDGAKLYFEWYKKHVK